MNMCCQQGQNNTNIHHELGSKIDTQLKPNPSRRSTGTWIKEGTRIKDRDHEQRRTDDRFNLRGSSGEEVFCFCFITSIDMVVGLNKK